MQIGFSVRTQQFELMECCFGDFVHTCLENLTLFCCSLNLVRNRENVFSLPNRRSILQRRVVPQRGISLLLFIFKLG